MFHETVTSISDSAKVRIDYMKSNLLKYLILSAMAGIYVGFGAVLIFSVGAPFAAANSPALKLVMGGSFGVALTLVMFAGSELFTGNNLFMTQAALEKKITWGDAAKNWFWVFIGNLIGGLFLAWLMVASGLISKAPQSDFIISVSKAKMSAPALQLVVRGILCNWLVCLAIWSSFKAKEEISRIFIIFWCLFAFIGSGFEHSIANMSLLAMAIFLNGEGVTWAGYAYNMFYVTLGNMISGILFMGTAYWFVSHSSNSIKQWIPTGKSSRIKS